MGKIMVVCHFNQIQFNNNTNYSLNTSFHAISRKTKHYDIHEDRVYCRSVQLDCMDVTVHDKLLSVQNRKAATAQIWETEPAFLCFFGG